MRMSLETYAATGHKRHMLIHMWNHFHMWLHMWNSYVDAHVGLFTCEATCEDPRATYKSTCGSTVEL